MSSPWEIALEPNKCALLVIDMQIYCATPGKGFFKDEDLGNISEEHQYIFKRLDETVIPNIQSLLDLFRSKKPKCDVIYTYIEALTRDGRDQSLEYKLGGFTVPKGNILESIL